MPACSSALMLSSSIRRCCGSSSTASRAETPKCAASKRSACSSAPCAGTKFGRARCSSGTAGSSSSGRKWRMPSRPSSRFCQKDSRSGEPGTRTAMPTMAMPPPALAGAARRWRRGALAAPAMAAAMPARVGRSYTSATPRVVMPASRTRETKRITSSDLAPMSKMFCSSARRSTPSSSHHSRRARASGSLASSGLASIAGRGRLRRSILPLGVTGRRSSTT